MIQEYGYTATDTTSDPIGKKQHWMSRAVCRSFHDQEYVQRTHNNRGGHDQGISRVLDVDLLEAANARI